MSLSARYLINSITVAEEPCGRCRLEAALHKLTKRCVILSKETTVLQSGDSPRELRTKGRKQKVKASTELEQRSNQSNFFNGNVQSTLDLSYGHLSALTVDGTEDS
jgi:hypothetical protein